MSSAITLPEDIILCILHLLPSKTLMRLRCVSKSWYSFITNPTVINHHLSNSLSNNKVHEHLLLLPKSYNKDKAPYTLIRENSISGVEQISISDLFKQRYPENGLDVLKELYRGHIAKTQSVRGLVCAEIDTEFYLLNPCIRTFKKLPPPPLLDTRFTLFGTLFMFGFDSITNDYKVIVIVNRERDILMYSLSSDSWKKIGVADLFDHRVLRHSSISFNGIIYWITPLQRSFLFPDINKKMFSFNIGQEQFQETMLPNYQSDFKYVNNDDDDDYYSLSIHMANESVLLLVMPPCERSHCYTWVMKEHNGGGGVITESWTKYCIEFPSEVNWRARGLNSNGEVVVLDQQQMLYVYDPKNTSYKETGTCPRYKFECNTFPDSLLLLDY